jgi:hypothetical protein
MAASDLRAWAVKGAEQRLLEIAEEARTIFQAFPELRGAGRGFDFQRSATRHTGGTADAGASPRRRRRMSAAARKAVGARMKKYWAERRKAAGKDAR